MQRNRAGEANSERIGPRSRETMARVAHGMNGGAIRRFVSIPLDYASPNLPRLPGRWLGALPLLVSASGAGAIFVSCTRLAAAAQMALMVPTTCGTGRHNAEHLLYFSMPFALAVPLCGWVGANVTGTGVVLARCCVWTSILAWGMSVLFVAFR